MADRTHRTYTVVEVAELLQVHPATVRRLIDKGELEGVYVGRLLRVMPEDLTAYLERSKRRRGDHGDATDDSR